MAASRRAWLAALVLAAGPIVLTSCADGGDGPSANPSRTADLPSPTRSASGGSPAEGDESRTPVVPESSRPTDEGSTTPTSTPDESATDEGSGDEGTTEVPSWIWWALAAAALLAVGIPLLLRSRRGGAWKSDLAAAEDEVAWVAHELVPELRRTGSREQAVGGWTVSSARVRTLEDRLTALEATAPGDPGRTHARILRDAVRSARTRLDDLASSEAIYSPTPELDSVAGDLEAALRRVGPQSRG